MIVDRYAAVVGLASHVIDGMSNDQLFSYAYDQLTNYFNGLSEDDLIDECDNAGFEIEVKL